MEQGQPEHILKSAGSKDKLKYRELPVAQVESFFNDWMM